MASSTVEVEGAPRGIDSGRGYGAVDGASDPAAPRVHDAREPAPVPDDDAQQMVASEGRAALRRMTGAAEAGSAMRSTLVWYIGQLCVAAAGVLLIYMFDREHAYFGQLLPVWALLFCVPVILLWRKALSPGSLDGLTSFRGAVEAAVAAEKNGANASKLRVVVGLLVPVLFVLFIFDSDIEQRGAVHSELELKIAAVALYYVGEGAPHCFTMCSGYQVAMDALMDVVLAAARGLADDVEAGMPLVEVERSAQRLYHLMRGNLRYSALVITMGPVACMVSLVLAINVVITEPSPPAFFVFFIPAVFGVALANTPAPVLVASQIARIPRGLRARALEASIRLHSGAIAGPSAPATAWAVKKVDVADDDGVAGGGRGRSDGGGDGDGGVARLEASVRRLQKQQALMLEHQHEVTAFDTLASRIEHMGTTWEVGGVPLSSTVVRGLRAVTLSVIVGVLREHVDLGF